MPAALYKKIGMSLPKFESKLKFLYFDKLMSQSKIAEFFHVHTTCIENWFKKLKIETRSQSSASFLRHKKHINLVELENNVLNGLLLSDLHIEMSQSGKQARCSFGLKYKEFANHIIDNLKCLDWSEPKHNEKTLGWHSKTKSFVELNEVRNRWYPDGKKIVPNIEINGDVLYWWYLGDGMMEDYGLSLCTDSFKKSDIDSLRCKLSDIGLCTSHTQSNNRIRVNSKSVKDFLEIIGKPKIKCYEYKWKYRVKKLNGVWV